MRSASIITLALFAGQTHAQDVDNLLERASQAPALDNTELDDTTLGKSHTSLKTMLNPTNLLATAPRTVPAARTNVMPARVPRTSSGFTSLTAAAPLNTPSLRGESVRNMRMFATPSGTDAKTVSALREATGAGMMDCKKMLVQTNGDFEEAIAELRKKGLASAEKRTARSTGEGTIETYIHGGGKIGVMVEVSCETDFVAKTPEFKEFAKEIAMQIVASPTVTAVDQEGVPEDFIKKEREILAGSEDMKGKPPEVIEKIIDGRIAKMLKTQSLIDQPYMKNPDETVQDFIKSQIAKFGENIKVARFTKFEVGR